MIDEKFSRSELLLGSAAMEKLKNSRVAVFGVGGVGGYAVEALARTGVGGIDIIDKDVVSQSNINRQIIATVNSVGRYKTEVMKERILSINPSATVNAYNVFYNAETAGQFDFSVYDYVIDAIDTVTCKLMLIEAAKSAGTPIISSMGAGNKLEPTAFEVADIYSSSLCPLARVMRRELKKRGVASLKVVYSKEEPMGRFDGENPSEEHGKRIPGSVAFVPSVAGLIIAGEVIKDLIKVQK